MPKITRPDPRLFTRGQVRTFEALWFENAVIRNERLVYVYGCQRTPTGGEKPLSLWQAPKCIAFAEGGRGGAWAWDLTGDLIVWLFGRDLAGWTSANGKFGHASTVKAAERMRGRQAVDQPFYSLRRMKDNATMSKLEGRHRQTHWADKVVSSFEGPS